MGDTPQYTPPPIDPATLAAEQQAQNEQVAALQTRTQGDTASLMAQYGILAMAANTGGMVPSANLGPTSAPGAMANTLATTMLAASGKT